MWYCPEPEGVVLSGARRCGTVRSQKVWYCLEPEGVVLSGARRCGTVRSTEIEKLLVLVVLLSDWRGRGRGRLLWHGVKTTKWSNDITHHSFCSCEMEYKIRL